MPATFQCMKEGIIAKLRALQPDLEAEGVEHLALFGSRARGDNREDSDIDLLLDVAPSRRFSLLNLIGVEHLVRDATGLPSNAFMRRSLDDEFRASAESHLVEIF
ncbi:MAG: nucleotidyltransferase family protein [Rhizobiaceae bacterium]